MQSANERPLIFKAEYRPVEAAIRWSGLLENEPEILSFVGAREVSDPAALAHWPLLQLNYSLILDGLRHGDLPGYVDGIETQKAEPGQANVLIRHVDLKAWMSHYFPEQRPSFLFGSLEDSMRVAIPVDAVHALLVQRDALVAQVEALRGRTGRASTVTPMANAVPRKTDQSDESRSRWEMTYLTILGSMLNVVLGRSPSGQRYSRFHTQESLIDAMVAQDGERRGISSRTLEAKFAAARRALDE